MIRLRHVVIVVGAVAGLDAAPSALAFEGPSGYSIGWSSVGPSGGDSAAADLTLRGSVGEAVTGSMSGGAFSLEGGFLAHASTAAPCPGDLDGSGEVEFTDLVTLLSSWGPCAGCAADLDGSGEVDFTDLVTLLSAWGSCGG